MNITFSPDVEAMIAKLAEQQSMTSEVYAERILRKHTIAQIRNQALDELVLLPVSEVKAVADTISAKFEEHNPKQEPTEEDPIRK